jgi:hypothetical protein
MQHWTTRIEKAGEWTLPCSPTLEGARGGTKGSGSPRREAIAEGRIKLWLDPLERAEMDHPHLGGHDGRGKLLGEKSVLGIRRSNGQDVQEFSDST